MNLPDLEGEWEWEGPPESRSRYRPPKRTVLATLLALSLIGAGAAAVASIGATSSEPPAQQRAVAPPQTLRLVERGSDVVLTWDDPNDGRVRYGLLGGDPYRQLLPMGAVSTMVVGIGSDSGACYRIAAVPGSGDWSAVSPQACVRGGRDVVVPPSPAAVAAAEAGSPPVLPSDARVLRGTAPVGQGTAVTPPVAKRVSPTSPAAAPTSPPAKAAPAPASGGKPKGSTATTGQGKPAGTGAGQTRPGAPGVGPVAPAKPAVPTVPTVPTVPVVPADPVDPVDPVGPADPVDPADPTDPTVPTDPEAPTDPTVPTDPVAPTDPTEPTDPGGGEPPDGAGP